VQKFHALVDPILGAVRARQIVDQVQRLDTLPDLRTLGSLCAGA